MRSIHQSKSARGEHIPAIKRVAPALAGGRKVIGRHAGNADGLQIFVEFENLRMHPNIGRIHVDEDRHIAQDPYRTACRSLFEQVPLPRKGKLQHLLDHALAPVFSGSRGQRLCIAASQRLGPLRPCAGVECAAQHRIKRVVVEPRSLVAGERLEFRPLLGQRRFVQSAIEKISRRLVEQRKLPRFHRLKIDWP